MRLYDESYLEWLYKDGGTSVLKEKLDLVKTDDSLTYEEKEENIRRIELAMNGGVQYTHNDAMEVINESLPDISDIGGN